MWPVHFLTLYIQWILPKAVKMRRSISDYSPQWTYIFLLWYLYLVCVFPTTICIFNQHFLNLCASLTRPSLVSSARNGFSFQKRIWTRVIFTTSSSATTHACFCGSSVCVVTLPATICDAYRVSQWINCRLIINEPSIQSPRGKAERRVKGGGIIVISK